MSIKGYYYQAEIMDDDSELYAFQPQVVLMLPAERRCLYTGQLTDPRVQHMGAVAGITSVLVVMMLGQIRVFFAISRDGLLGSWLSVVHPRFGTPHHATILTGIGVAVMAALFLFNRKTA